MGFYRPLELIGIYYVEIKKKKKNKKESHT